MEASVGRRFAVSSLLLALAASVVLTGAANSGFTSASSTGTGTLTLGTADLTLGPAGPANRLSVDATGLVPGDRVERAVDLTNGGTLDLSGVSLTTTATQSSALDTDTTAGLDVSVARCSVAWTEAGTAPGYTYTCSGTVSTVLSTRPVIMAGAALAGLTSTTAGATDHLRVLMTLPASAGDAMQGLSSRLAFTFTAAGAP